MHSIAPSSLSRAGRSPWTISPSKPAQEISTPKDFAPDLAELIGPYYTQGMPEDTNALKDTMFSDDDYVSQVALVQEEAPWSFGYNPYAAGAYHQWLANTKPSNLIKDLLLYYRLDPALRAQKVAEWNKPIVWPVVAIALVLIAAIAPAIVAWRRRERETAARTLAARGAG